MGNQPNRDRSFQQNNSNLKCDLAIEEFSSDISLNIDSDLWINETCRESKSLRSFTNSDSKIAFTYAKDDCRKNKNSSISLHKEEKLKFICFSQDGQWAHVEKFGTFEKGWVQASIIGEIFEETQDSDFYLQQFKWYHGEIPRSFAEYLLNSGITGSFLVRESESNKMLRSISLRYEGKIWHFRISKDSINKYYVTENQRFDSIPKLIEYHSKYGDGLPCQLLYPAPKRAHATVFGVDESADVWEIDRTEIMMKNQLGGGQYGIVYEGFWTRHNCKVAVKTVKSDITMAEDFLEEARLMKSLQHPNLVRLLGVCTREPPNYIITEFMENGNLLDYLRNKPKEDLLPPVLLYMAIQIAAGMAYLEEHNFIHRDLAARNCLVGVDNIVKVADFGLARCMERDDTYTAHAGAKFPIKWTAPEGLAYNLFSTKSDVWAFGVLLWELATYGMTPYPGIELQDVYVYLQKGNIMGRPAGCPENIYDLMKHCWKWQPEDRPSFKELHNNLEIMLTDINEQVDLEIAKESDVSFCKNNLHLVNNTYYEHDIDDFFQDEEPLPQPPNLIGNFGKKKGPPAPPVRTTTLKDRSMTSSFTMSSNPSLMEQSISEDFPSILPENDGLPLPPPDEFLNKSIDIAMPASNESRYSSKDNSPSLPTKPFKLKPVKRPDTKPQLNEFNNKSNKENEKVSGFSFLALSKPQNATSVILPKPDVVKRTKSDRNESKTSERDFQSELKSRLKMQSKSDDKTIDMKINESKQIVIETNNIKPNPLWPNRKSMGHIKPVSNVHNSNFSSNNFSSNDHLQNNQTIKSNTPAPISKRMSWTGPITSGPISVRKQYNPVPLPSQSSTKLFVEEEDCGNSDTADDSDEFITKETLISEMNSIYQELANLKQRRLDVTNGSDVLINIIDKLETIHLGSTRFGNSVISSAKIKFKFLERCTDLSKSIQNLRKFAKPFNYTPAMEITASIKSTLSELKTLIES